MGSLAEREQKEGGEAAALLHINFMENKGGVSQLDRQMSNLNRQRGATLANQLTQ